MDDYGVTRLWQSVVLTALNDSKLSNHSKFNKYRHQNMQAAREWLLYNKTSFYAICYWANIDPVTLRNRAKKMFIENDCSDKRKTKIRKYIKPIRAPLKLN